MKKQLIVLIPCFLIAGFTFSQSDEKPADGPKIKEIPVASSHGKSVSELAASTPSDSDKGKLISSAARQRGIISSQNNFGKGNTESSSAQNRKGLQIKGSASRANSTLKAVPRNQRPALKGVN